MAAPKLIKINKNRYITALIGFIAIVLAIYFLFIFEKGAKEIKKDEPQGEVKQLAQVELKNRPYVTLTPTTDGAEIIVSIENMSFFDDIEYEMTYLADNPQSPSEKIQRGATGTGVNTKDEKYKTSVLLGTASKGVRSPDRGVSDGKLTMHMFKGDVEYQSEHEWVLVEIGKTATTLKDSQGNFELEVPPTLGKTYWAILADTIGIPPSADFDSTTVATPVYGTFSVAPKFSKPTSLTIKLSKDVQTPILHIYNSVDSKWATKDVNYNSTDKTITTTVDNFATFIPASK